MKLSNTGGPLVARFGWRRAIEIMSNAGYDAIDGNFCSYLNDTFEHGKWSTENYINRANEVRGYLEEAGFACNQTHAPFSFPGKVWDTQFEEVCFPQVLRALEITAILGADVCVVHPIHHFEYLGNEERAFELNMAYYSRLAEHAKKLGVRIGVENMWQRDVRRKCISHDTCSTSEEYIRYIDTINDPVCVACLDVGHISIIQRRDEVWDVIRALGHDRLHALHVHDNGFCGDDHLMPFSGKMNWGEICRALGEIDYDGDLTFEVGGAFFGNVPESFIPTATAYSAAIGRELISMIDAARPKK